MAGNITSELQGNLQEMNPVFNFQPVFASFAQPFNVNPSGIQFEVNWPDIAGIDAIELEEAHFALSPDHTSLGASLGSFPGQSDTTQLDITLPAPPKIVRSITLNGFKINIEGTFHNVNGQNDLPAGYRIAVALFEGNDFGAPVVSVPPTDRRGAIPPLLTGGSFGGKVFKLPDLQTGKFRLMVVKGGIPEEFTQIPFTVSSVVLRAAPYASDLELLNDEASPLWNLPGAFKEGTTIDLKQAVTQGLNKALDSGNPLTTHVTVKSSNNGSLYHFGLHTKGQLHRNYKEKIKFTLEGGRQTMPLPGPKLDEIAPIRVTADVTLKHQGMRLHQLSDDLPDRKGNLAGPVVGNDPVIRQWPAQAFLNETLKKIGLFGHSPEPTDVSIRLMTVSEGGGVTPMNSEWGTASVEPNGNNPELIWIDLPDYGSIDHPVALEVKTTKGRFLWIENDLPIVQVAVAYTPQSDDKILIGTTPVLFSGMESQYLEYTLDAASFRSTSPDVNTDQFTDVVLSNLILRYRS